MKVNIFSSKCPKIKSEGISLNENDFHPCRPFFIEHSEIIPETIEQIYIKGIFEQHPYIRCVLRYCDYMLAPNGKLIIDFFDLHFDTNGFDIRGQNEWLYELSLVFGDRILLESKVTGRYIFYKKSPFLPEGDSISKWSFGIVTDWKKKERIKQMISTIASFHIPEFEILICGPFPKESFPNYVKILDDSSFYIDKRIPISKKKNHIITNAKYNNLIIIHDRISFPDDWYKKMKRYGNYFDCLSVPLLNEDDHSKRMQDWITYRNTTYKSNLWSRIKYKRSALSYNEWVPDIYINGGFIQIKRHLMLDVMLNPNLNWGEKEDVDFSVRAYNKGILFEFFKDNQVYSMSTRFSGGKYYNHISVFTKIRYAIGGFRRYLKEKKAFNRYLNNERDLCS